MKKISKRIPIVVHLPPLSPASIPLAQYQKLQPFIAAMGGVVPGTKVLLSIYRDRDGSLFVVRKDRTICFVGAAASGSLASSDLWWALSRLHGGTRTKPPSTVPWIGFSKRSTDTLTLKERKCIGNFVGPLAVALLRYHME